VPEHTHQAQDHGGVGGTRQRWRQHFIIWSSLRLWQWRVLRIMTPAAVHIIGAPVACAEGLKDTWRDVTKYAADQLRARFGDAVRVHYFDLFDPDCPALPDGAQLPLVLLNGEVFSSGGKISVPALRKHLETSGVAPDDN
jgi:hypothetical protein